MKKTNDYIPVVIGGYYNAYSIIRSLGEKGILSILITTSKGTFVEQSKYVSKKYYVPYNNDDEMSFLKIILKIGKELYPVKGVVFPTHDEQLLFFAKYKATLNTFFVCPFSDYSVIERIMDKSMFSEDCGRLGIPIIKEWKINSIREFNQIIKEIEYPVIIKPTYTDDNIIKCLGQKICYVENEEECCHLLENLYRLINNAKILIQEYIKDSNLEFSILP